MIKYIASRSDFEAALKASADRNSIPILEIQAELPCLHRSVSAKQVDSDFSFGLPILYGENDLSKPQAAAIDALFVWLKQHDALALRSEWGLTKIRWPGWYDTTRCRSCSRWYTQPDERREAYLEKCPAGGQREVKSHFLQPRSLWPGRLQPAFVEEALEEIPEGVANEYTLQYRMKYLKDRKIRFAAEQQVRR